MWDFFFWYCIFCVTTGVSCVFYFWRPIIKKAEELKVASSLVTHPMRGTFIYFCLATVAAPLMFWILFNTGMSARYTEGLEKIINEQDE